ncbi:hypothetical protein SO802_019857 [Lithocarpus litseifolius]|uniref:Uncharacterized protein n=1 Tax=Lithocarpus litseifolius TaxID=425828 RepID=A0AAW2CPW3_9ROSI
MNKLTKWIQQKVPWGVPLPFSTFIGYCKQRMQNRDFGCANSELESPGLIGRYAEHAEDALEQIYLAQTPIMNADNEEKVQLETLREDIETGGGVCTK